MIIKVSYENCGVYFIQETDCEKDEKECFTCALL